MTRSQFQEGPAQDHYHNTLGVDEEEITQFNGGTVTEPLNVSPTPQDSSVDASLIVKGCGRPDVFMIERQNDTTRPLGIDEDGFIATSGGISMGSSGALTDFGTILNIRGNAVGVVPGGSYLKVRSGSSALLFEIKGDGSTTIYAADNQPALRVAADGTVHIRTGGSIVADL